MPRCSICGREFPEEELIRCSECGEPYCRECAGKDASMRVLGICSDCEEAHGVERTWTKGSKCSEEEGKLNL